MLKSTQLPLDVNCDALEPPLGVNIESPVSQVTPDLDHHPHHPHAIDPLLQSHVNTLTSMTSALHVIRLRRIESQIQATYRLDQRQTDVNEVRSLLEKIDIWIEGFPQRMNDPGWATVPCCSEDWFLMKGESARLMLLRPISAKAKMGDPMLVRCAQSAAHLCEVRHWAFKRSLLTHRRFSVVCIRITLLPTHYH